MTKMDDIINNTSYKVFEDAICKALKEDYFSEAIEILNNQEHEEHKKITSASLGFALRIAILKEQPGLVKLICEKSDNMDNIEGIHSPRRLLLPYRITTDDLEKALVEALETKQFGMVKDIVEISKNRDYTISKIRVKFLEEALVQAIENNQLDLVESIIDDFTRRKLDLIPSIAKIIQLSSKYERSDIFKDILDKFNQKIDINQLPEALLEVADIEALRKNEVRTEQDIENLQKDLEKRFEIVKDIFKKSQEKKIPIDQNILGEVLIYFASNNTKLEKNTEIVQLILGELDIEHSSQYLGQALIYVCLNHNSDLIETMLMYSDHINSEDLLESFKYILMKNNNLERDDLKPKLIEISKNILNKLYQKEDYNYIGEALKFSSSIGNVENVAHILQAYPDKISPDTLFKSLENSAAASEEVFFLIFNKIDDSNNFDNSYCESMFCNAVRNYNVDMVKFILSKFSQTISNDTINDMLGEYAVNSAEMFQYIVDAAADKIDKNNLLKAFKTSIKEGKFAVAGNIVKNLSSFDANDLGEALIAVADSGYTGKKVVSAILKEQKKEGKQISKEDLTRAFELSNGYDSLGEHISSFKKDLNSEKEVTQDDLFEVLSMVKASGDRGKKLVERIENDENKISKEHLKEAFEILNKYDKFRVDPSFTKNTNRRICSLILEESAQREESAQIAAKDIVDMALFHLERQETKFAKYIIEKISPEIPSGYYEPILQKALLNYSNKDPESKEIAKEIAEDFMEKVDSVGKYENMVYELFSDDPQVVKSVITSGKVKSAGKYADMIYEMFDKNREIFEENKEIVEFLVTSSAKYLSLENLDEIAANCKEDKTILELTNKEREARQKTPKPTVKIVNKIDSRHPLENNFVSKVSDDKNNSTPKDKSVTQINDNKDNPGNVI